MWQSDPTSGPTGQVPSPVNLYEAHRAYRLCGEQAAYSSGGAWKVSSMWPERQALVWR